MRLHLRSASIGGLPSSPWWHSSVLMRCINPPTTVRSTTCGCGSGRLTVPRSALVEQYSRYKLGRAGFPASIYLSYCTSSCSLVLLVSLISRRILFFSHIKLVGLCYQLAYLTNRNARDPYILERERHGFHFVGSRDMGLWEWRHALPSLPMATYTPTLGWLGLIRVRQ